MEITDIIQIAKDDSDMDRKQGGKMNNQTPKSMD